MRSIARVPKRNFFKEAFFISTDFLGFEEVPINIIVFVTVLFFSIVYGNPLFVIGTVICESLFLMGAAISPSFKARINRRDKIAARNAQLDRIDNSIASLKSKQALRFNALNNVVRDINKVMHWSVDDENMEYRVTSFAMSKQNSLNQTVLLFLKLLRTKQMIDECLGKSNEGRLQAQIAKFEEQIRIGNLSKAVERSVRANIDIYRKRITNFDSIRENASLVELELQRIENQVSMFREGLAVDGSPENLSAGIELVNDNLSATQQWISNNGEFLRKLNAPLFSDDIDFMI